jgi:hypothetical protein
VEFVIIIDLEEILIYITATPLLAVNGKSVAYQRQSTLFLYLIRKNNERQFTGFCIKWLASP